MSVSTKYAHGYAAYLNSPEWGEKRRGALQHAQHQCQGCGARENLEVHHLTYERMGYERLTDLQVLCNTCHAMHHGRAPSRQNIAGPTVKELTLRVEERQRENRTSFRWTAVWIEKDTREFLLALFDRWRMGLENGRTREEKEQRRWVVDHEDLLRELEIDREMEVTGLGRRELYERKLANRLKREREYEERLRPRMESWRELRG